VDENDQVVPVALLIPEKQVLAVRGVDAGPVLFGLLDGRNRRMLVARIRNRELRQPRRDFIFVLANVNRWMLRSVMIVTRTVACVVLTCMTPTAVPATEPRPTHSIFGNAIR
jgi:hypothetical protein